MRTSTDRSVTGGTLPSLAIPTSLYASLMARLDRLTTARQVAQIGAAIGREFSYELLRAVWAHSEEELQTALARLVASELVYQTVEPQVGQKRKSAAAPCSSPIRRQTRVSPSVVT